MGYLRWWHEILPPIRPNSECKWRLTGRRLWSSTATKCCRTSCFVLSNRSQGASATVYGLDLLDMKERAYAKDHFFLGSSWHACYSQRL